MILFLLGELIFVVLIWSLILVGSPWHWFVDIPGIIVTLGIGSTLTMISFSFKDLSMAFQHAFGGEGSTVELQKSAYIWECVARNLILASVLGLIIGTIQILQNLDNPNDIGPMFSLALLTVFYGFFFSALFPFPAMFMIKKRIDTE